MFEVDGGAQVDLTKFYNENNAWNGAVKVFPALNTLAKKPTSETGATSVGYATGGEGGERCHMGARWESSGVTPLLLLQEGDLRTSRAQVPCGCAPPTTHQTDHLV